MTTTLTEDTRIKLQELLRALRLLDIQPIQIHMDRTGFGATPDVQGKQVKISWKQVFHRDDPMAVEPDRLAFRLKYELSIVLEEQVLYQHTAVFGILFEVVDRSAFDDAWASEDLRQVFREKQVVKTLWPFLRQQVVDGMNRVGLKGVTLPWIL